VLGLPGFTNFLKVLCEDFAALRSSFAPEMPSYAQKWPSDGKFHGAQDRFHKSLNLRKKFFCGLEELANALR
jgi:hypothetical protein